MAERRFEIWHIGMVRPLEAFIPDGRHLRRVRRQPPRWQRFKGDHGVIKDHQQRGPASREPRFSELAQNNPGLDETLILVN